MSTAARLPRSRAWLRVLVLLLAVLVPATSPEASAAPVVAGEITEYDLLGTAVRPVSCAHRPAVPLRPEPSTDPARGAAAGRPRPGPPRPPYTPHTLRALRTVVLRC
ncbi:hypothetical protein ACFY30_22625 [Streptomyces sp. NPDC000345]|uniref:hypothetical protein n=1 Tax=Streptomyces sp. NPDC000345 TaxID=3364537 RepID=UPI0036CDCAD4